MYRQNKITIATTNVALIAGVAIGCVAVASLLFYLIYNSGFLSFFVLYIYVFLKAIIRRKKQAKNVDKNKSNKNKVNTKELNGVDYLELNSTHNPFVVVNNKNIENNKDNNDDNNDDENEFNNNKMKTKKK